MNSLIRTRGLRGAMVACAALTLTTSAIPAWAAGSAAESTPSAAAPQASGWSESRVTRGDAPLIATTRPDARTTWVAGARFVGSGDDLELVPALWERDERKGPGWKRVKTAPVPRGDVRFNDVDASSPRNAMLVGDYTEQSRGVVTQRWNGRAWKSAVAPVPRGAEGGGLLSVDTRAPGDAWAAGYAQVRAGGRSSIVGTVQHWDGTRWKAQKLPDVTAGDRDLWWQLSSVAALAADDV
ncbi:hypothetical protein ABT112_25250 [Streptomyces sp. NPDC002055]|uniref:hypothetical protein n=1 Tax=Streptomyces sp. NPDC002055 TaxID=3154534 RepID=UPI00331AEDFB